MEPLPEDRLVVEVQRQPAGIVSALRETGLLSEVVGTLPQSFSAICSDTRGVVVSQMMTSPWSKIIPLAREYRQAIKDSGSSVPVSYSSFEGFVAAKLVVTALRLAGSDPTRERFMAALESMHELDLGGLTVRFFAKDHRGSNFVDLTLIGRGGKYIR